MSEKSFQFISYLEKLKEKEERGALAALRRGLGRPPGTAPEMYRYVVPWLPETPNRSYEQACYLVAALFAYHPDSARTGNLGDHMRQAAGDHQEATERRFSILLAAHPEDLSVYLRQAISFLRSKNVAVNWHQLFYDLQYWGHPDGFVQKRWADAFWRRHFTQTHETETDTQSEQIS